MHFVSNFLDALISCFYFRIVHHVLSKNPVLAKLSRGNYRKKPVVICDALRDLVPFVQFKKREKHPWRSVTFSKVAALSCKQRNASHILHNVRSNNNITISFFITQ